MFLKVLKAFSRKALTPPIPCFSPAVLIRTSFSSVSQTLSPLCPFLSLCEPDTESTVIRYHRDVAQAVFFICNVLPSYFSFKLTPFSSDKCLSCFDWQVGGGGAQLIA